MLKTKDEDIDRRNLGIMVVLTGVPKIQNEKYIDIVLGTR